MERRPNYTLQRSLQTPAQVTSLAFGHAGHLFAGSVDGSLRVYDLSSFKVLKAVRGLGSEISSIVCVKRPGSELRDAWTACGKRILRFQLDSPKMVQTVEDALLNFELCNSEDDVLNELALNPNRSHLAFSMDSGIVGVIDLSTQAVSMMQTKHQNVCGSVKFIPGRPHELVSGGYDMALIHFDFVQGNVLSRREIPTYITNGGMTLSPPFVTSMVMSSRGILAAGTADGRLWLGCLGQKHAGSQAKKKGIKKWDGLREEKELVIKVAEGPIVAMTFTEPATLTLATLLGMLIQHHLEIDTGEGSLVLHKVWEKETQIVKKVNALVTDEKRIIVGGLTLEGKGVTEIWRRD